MDEWRELNTRWFQFGAFVPLFRSHGQYPYREIYNIAPVTHPAYQSMVYYDKLRYALMPYLYSLAGWTWTKDYTLMRGLVMDFADDARVAGIGDQFMLGPALLVSPVYEFKARTRELYLPSACGWYDLYDGSFHEGGQTVKASAPLERMPLYVKEGAILPLGPEIEYTGQKPADPLTLYIYMGRDASFELYEDEGVNYNYEDGAYSTIPFKYTESTKTLTIGARHGQFNGMPMRRDFRIIWVNRQRPVGVKPVPADPQPVLHYEGSEITISYK